jgi:large subunit ribosomal protein L9
MKVILQKDVINLGDAGDLKEVAPGFARNFLLPQKLAVLANDGSAKVIAHQLKLSNLKKENRKKIMVELSTKIESLKFSVTVKVGENDKLFGSVTSQDIANAMKKEGIELDKRKIEISEPIKSLGSFQVKVKLAEGIQSTIQLEVEKAK